MTGTLPAGTRDGQDRRGAVLAVLVVLSGVLAILAASVFVLFQANVSSWRYRDGRVRAQLAAEAGVSLALHTLALETGAPAGEPLSMPGDSAQWMTMPWGDHVWVVIDPSDQNGMPFSIGSVEIRARGMSGNMTMDVAVRAAPDYPSRYALLTDAGIPAGLIHDGTRIEGPVHSNGTIHLDSTSPDSTDDPWVEFISTTADGGFSFSDVGPGTLPHPEGSRVWMRPYGCHRQGRPYWEPMADPVDFARLEQLFADLRSQASQEGGEVLWNARRIIIDGDRLLCSSDQAAAPDTVELEGTDLVYLAGYSDVLIKSRSPLDMPLTIVSNGQVGIMGQIRCNSGVMSDARLGIVALSGFFVARDPDLYGGADWPPPWDIATDGHVSVYASLCAPDGSIRAEDPTAGGNLYSLNIVGGLAVQRLGTMGTGSRGYTLTIAYDRALSSTHPPRFPSLEHWKMYSWMPEPDFEGDIGDNLY